MSEGHVVTRARARRSPACARLSRARALRLCMGGIALTVTTTCTPAPITDRGYEEVFYDNFDGDEVGPHWATAPFGGSLPATIEDGFLTLRTTMANDFRWAYIASTGPRLDDEPNYRFASAWEEGYFEARVRYTDNPWAWPAFWLFSMAKTEAWPGENCDLLNAEWDIMENGVGNHDGQHPASRWHVSGIHRNTTDNSDDGYCSQPDTTRGFTSESSDVRLSDWHTWAGRWTANELCTYIDGVEIQCMEPYDTTAQPMHMVFTMQYLRGCDGCPARPASLEMQVDWVRVWQKN